MKVRLSLVVCTINRTWQLDRFLASLKGQRDSIEVLIVDQNAPGFLDGVLRSHNDLPLRVMRAPKGLSRARNVGIQEARGTIVAFPDDDCWYPKDTLQQAAARLDALSNVSMVTGKTLDQNGCESVSPFAARSLPITRRNVFVCGNETTLFVRSSVARSVLFDERLGLGSPSPFQSGEGPDFILRALDQGHSGLFDPSLIVHHDQVTETLERVRTYSRGYGHVVRKNQLGASFVIRPIARTAASALARTAIGDIKGARNRMVWAAGTVYGYTRRNSIT